MNPETAALIARLLRWPPDWGDPLTQGAAAALGALAVVGLLVAALAAARRAARATAPLAAEVAAMAALARTLAEGQHRLDGALRAAAEAQGAQQRALGERVERRLHDVERRVGDTLHGAAARTARSLGELQARLEAIDRAQGRLEKLSGEVLSLQDILSNKQARGAFGEIQLADLVGKALPPDAFTLQATLSNGRRVDCLIRLPEPPGPIAVDAKFPLEAWEALVAATDERGRTEAARGLRAAVRRHVADIAERYVIPGETAAGALMFLPSEAVYAELHARHGEAVREGFAKGVWIVSPTTLMATLTTLRGVLRDARLREQAGAVRRELGLLHGDLGRLAERVAALDRHFEQARRDVEGVVISAEKASARAARLEALDFAESAAPPPRLTALGE